MSELTKFQKEIGDWASETFDSKREYYYPACVIGLVNHLKREVAELAESFLTEEAVDCFLILLHFAHLHKFDLLDEARKKMEINYKREWGEPDKDGVIEHVKK